MALPTSGPGAAEPARPVYTARATAYGDGRAGHVTSDDDVLDLDLAVPTELGGQGGDLTNPEQMFAAGYAACFHGAFKRVAAQAKAGVTGSTITAAVSLNRQEDRLVLAVALQVAAPALASAQVRELAEQAHQRCPYSDATRGNIPVTVEVAP